MSDPRLEELAEQLVAAGRVVPGLAESESGDGRFRSWWWPLPAASDRAAIAGLLSDGAVEAQVALATDLSESVDGLVRRRIRDEAIAFLPPRPGRRSVSEAWVRSLNSTDPWLPPSLDPDRVRRLETEVNEWIRSGAAVPSSVRLCLRVVEPPMGDELSAALDDSIDGSEQERLSIPDDPWRVEMMVQDPVDTALMVPFHRLFSASSPFAGTALEEALTAIVRAARLAPELRPVLEQSIPTDVEFSSGEIIDFISLRSGVLVEDGVALLMPRWWTSSGRSLGLRAKASSPSVPVDSATGSGFGFADVVGFSWEASLGGEPLSEEDVQTFAAAVEAKQHLVRFRGQWVELDPATVAAVVSRIGTESTATAGELLRAALGVGDLGLGAELEPASGKTLDLVVESGGWIGDFIDDALEGRFEPVESPPGFDGVLREYQQRGVGWLAFLGRLGMGACLADDMGLGKTAQLIGTLLADPVEGPSLVVCPVSVLGNWERELQRFAPSLVVMAHHGPGRERDRAVALPPIESSDVVLTTYSLLDRDLGILGEVDWGRVVLDEAQQVKNANTRAAKAVRTLRARRRVALTGTPVENRLGELWSLMHYLNPGLLGSASSFRDRFARPIEANRDEDAMATLSRLTSPFILRRLKSDRSVITDLPDKIETVDHCPLTKEQASLYQSTVEDLLRRADEAEGIERRGLVLAGISRLKQICNHPAHFLGDNSALPGRSGKLLRAEELLEELLAAGDKALLFTQFTAWGDQLAPYLAARFGVESLWLHGGVRRARREEMMEDFARADGPPLMLLSLKAGGTGLNLVAASHVIHFDRWWNPAVEDQATDRAYRIGQTESVQVHKLVSTATIEERIDSMITSKADLANSVVRAGEGWLTELNTSELADVLTLSGGEIV